MIIRVRWTVEVRVENDGETKSRVSDERLEACAFEKVDGPRADCTTVNTSGRDSQDADFTCE